MKRLIKARHDYLNRNSAILVINGKVYEGDNHPDLVTKYYDEYGDYDSKVKYIKEKLNNKYDQDDAIKELNESGKIPMILCDSDTEWERDFNASIPVAFAHKDNNNNIFLETNAIYNISKSEATALLKKEYPDSFIYDDDSVPNESEDNPDNYKKIAKKKD